MSLFKKISSKALISFTVNGFLEFGPILVFLLAYDYFHIFKATFVLMIATIIVTVFIFIKQKRLPYASLYLALITTIFGYLTLSHHNPGFIQIRDTVYDVTNAIVLSLALLFEVLLFKIAFDKVMPMTDRAWRKLTWLWIFFFVAAALLNEYIRKHEPLHTWINYKTSMVFVSVIFGFAAIFYTYERKEAVALPPLL